MRISVQAHARVSIYCHGNKVTKRKYKALNMYVNLCAKCGVNYAMLQCHCFRAKGMPVCIIDTANYRSGVLHFEIEETQRNSDHKEKKLLLRIRAMIENQIAFSPRRVYCLYEIIDYYYYCCYCCYCCYCYCYCYCYYYYYYYYY